MKLKRTRKDNKTVQAITSSNTPVPPAPLAFDPGKYRCHVAHLGLDAERETERLLAVWKIMGNFVDRAHGDDPVQHVDQSRIADEKAIRGVVEYSSIDPSTHTAGLSSAFARPAAGKRGKEPR